jgi:hypothetical protein
MARMVSQGAGLSKPNDNEELGEPDNGRLPLGRRALLSRGGAVAVGVVGVGAAATVMAPPASAQSSLTGETLLLEEQASAPSTPTGAGYVYVNSIGTLEYLGPNGIITAVAPVGHKFSPMSFGAVGNGTTADDTAIATTISAMSTGDVLDLSGAPVSYAITMPIIVPNNCSVIGGFKNAQTGGPDVVCLSAFSGIAALTEAGAIGTGASPTSTPPVSVFGLSVDMSAVTSATSDGICFMTFGSWIYFCEIKNAPGNAFHYTDRNAGGYVIANTAVENRVCFNKVNGVGNTGILVDCYATSPQALTDGYCTDNIINLNNINIGGSASNSTGVGIDLECSADWHCERNHIYRAPNDAIVINRAFIAWVCNNEVDNYGSAGAESTTYHGIYIKGTESGPASFVINNDVRGSEQYGAASTTYQYYAIVGAGTSANIVMTGNCANQQTSGTATSVARAFTASSGTLNIIESGTIVQPASSSPTLSAVNIISGTVNLVKPGSTQMNSGGISVPIGVSGEYGAATTLLAPLIDGTAFGFQGLTEVWGGTYTAGDDANVLITATWDDGTTTTDTGGQISQTGTVNPVIGGMAGLFKNGRQMVKLSIQARSQLSSTMLTLTVTALSIAA